MSAEEAEASLASLAQRNQAEADQAQALVDAPSPTPTAPPSSDQPHDSQSPVHAAASKEAVLCGIDDGVYCDGGDVALPDFDHLLPFGGDFMRPRLPMASGEQG